MNPSASYISASRVPTTDRSSSRAACSSAVSGISRPPPAGRLPSPESCEAASCADYAQYIDRAGPGADAPQAVRHCLAGDAPRLAGGFERRIPEGEPRRQCRGVRAARTVGGALQVSRALDHLESLAIEEAIAAVLEV